MKTPSQGRCSRCNTIQALNSHNRCLECDRSYHSEYRAKNREKLAERQRKWREAHPERAQYEREWHIRSRKEKIASMTPEELKDFRKHESSKTLKRQQELFKLVINTYGGKCTCCGESELSFLTIDHINNDGKQERQIMGESYTFYRNLIKRGFPNNVQVLCRNCNWGKYVNRGICPHQSHRQGLTTIPEGGVEPSGSKLSAPII